MANTLTSQPIMKANQKESSQYNEAFNDVILMMTILLTFWCGRDAKWRLTQLLFIVVTVLTVIIDYSVTFWWLFWRIHVLLRRTVFILLFCDDGVMTLPVFIDDNVRRD